LCLENAAISASGLAPDKPFRMRFELRSVQTRDLSRVMGDLGISLTSMIEIFKPESRRGRVLSNAGDGLAASAQPAAALGPAGATRVNRLRNRLILVFLAATLAPLGATIWVTTTLLKWNPNYSAVGQLDAQAGSLRSTGRELYQRGARRP